MHFLWMRIKPSDLNMMDTVYNCKTAQFAEISANFGSRAPNGCGWATSGFKMQICNSLNAAENRRTPVKQITYK